MKTCTKCGVGKAPTEFSPATQCRDGLRPECKSCHNRLEKLRKVNDAVRYQARVSSQRGYKRAERLRRVYGLAPADYDELVRSQGGVCAICKEPQRWRAEPLSVDHDHATGRVRGLLCHPCNLLVGYAEDRASVLRAAAAYIEDRVEVKQDEAAEDAAA